MQIVIDIPKTDYEACKEQVKMIEQEGVFYESSDYALKKSIAKGIRLPKGHGRLGDLDALEKEIVNGIKAGNYEEGYETFAHINDMDDCIECVKYADTIIEADKTRDCNNCAHSDQGRCAGTEVCHECMWSNKFVEADKGSEDKG